MTWFVSLKKRVMLFGYPNKLSSVDNLFFLSMYANRSRLKIIKKQQKGGGSHILWLSDNFLVVKITLHLEKLNKSSCGQIR
jgi:hypothetical protein